MKCGDVDGTSPEVRSQHRKSLMSSANEARQALFVQLEQLRRLTDDLWTIHTS
jgi:hypothetical protein